MKHQSKAARIRALYAQGKSTGEISEIVGCRIEYVRVAARQRVEVGPSEIDRRYLMRKYGGDTLAEAWRNAWANDPKHRDRLSRNYAKSMMRKYGGADVAEATRNKYATDNAFRESKLAAAARYRRKKRQQRLDAAEARA